MDTKKSTVPEDGALERVMGVEPTCQPWEGRILPMNYTRIRWLYYSTADFKMQLKSLDRSRVSLQQKKRTRMRPL